jgi:hypothetical protein
MECWGCKENHRYRYFPHRNDKVRVLHNVQQAKIMEDMSSRIPGIYAVVSKLSVSRTQLM